MNKKKQPEMLLIRFKTKLIKKEMLLNNINPN